MEKSLSHIMRDKYENSHKIMHKDSSDHKVNKMLSLLFCFSPPFLLLFAQTAIQSFPARTHQVQTHIDTAVPQ